MDDLTQRVQAFLDAYTGDAPTEDTVVEIVSDLENDRRRTRARWEALRDGPAQKEVAMSDWHPVGTHPHREFECLWWVVPKTAEESWCNTSGEPIVSKSRPRIVMGQYGSWGCLCKATHWSPLPSPPTVSGKP